MSNGLVELQVLPASALPQRTALAPTAEKFPVPWRHTLEKPAGDWFKPDFNDAPWKRGAAPFGTEEPPVARQPNTVWTSADLWLRREFEMPPGRFTDLSLLLHHGLTAGSMAPAPAADALAAKDSGTTRWPPDPFPNVAPRVRDRHATVEMDTASRTPSVLLGVYDVENDPVTLSSFTKPAHGSVTANKDGTFTYAPQRGYLGDDEFAVDELSAVTALLHTPERSR